MDPKIKTQLSQLLAKLDVASSHSTGAASTQFMLQASTQFAHILGMVGEVDPEFITDFLESASNEKLSKRKLTPGLDPMIQAMMGPLMNSMATGMAVTNTQASSASIRHKKMGPDPFAAMSPRATQDMVQEAFNGSLAALSALDAGLSQMDSGLQQAQTTFQSQFSVSSQAQPSEKFHELISKSTIDAASKGSLAAISAVNQGLHEIQSGLTSMTQWQQSGVASIQSNNNIVIKKSAIEEAESGSLAAITGLGIALNEMQRSTQGVQQQVQSSMSAIQRTSQHALIAQLSRSNDPSAMSRVMSQLINNAQVQRDPMDAGATMINMVGELSTDELIALVEAKLDNITGVEDVATIMMLLSELGLSIPAALLQKVEEKLTEFVTDLATSIPDPMTLMSMLSVLKGMIGSNVSDDVIDNEDVKDIIAQKLVGIDASERDSIVGTAAAMGLQIEQVPPMTSIPSTETTPSSTQEALAGLQRDKAEVDSKGASITKEQLLDRERPRIDRVEKISKLVHEMVDQQSPSLVETMLSFITDFSGKELGNVIDELVLPDLPGDS